MKKIFILILVLSSSIFSFSQLSVNINPIYTFCPGEVFQMNPVITSNNSSSLVYNWSPSVMISNPNDENPFFAPILNTTFTLIVDDTITGVSVMATFEARVDTTGSISGIAVTSTSVVVANTKVYLISHDTVNQFLTAIDSVNTDALGTYSFSSVSEGTYYVKIAPDMLQYPTLIPTYFSNSSTFQSASSVQLSACDSLTVDLSPIVGANLGGPGFIGGFISNGAGKNHDFIPLENLDLIIYSQSINAPIAHAKTDANGYFSFTDLSLDSYAIYVDKPLVDNNLAPVITIDMNESSSDSLLFELEETKLTLNDEKYTSISMLGQTIQFAVFPNPIEHFMFLSIPNNEIKKLSMFNSLGQEIFIKETEVNTNKINISSFLKGTYIVCVETISGQKAYRKIIKK